MSNTFRHSGESGDIIFSLPAIRAIGGGILYIDPEGGKSSPLVKWQGRDCTRMNAAKIAQLKPLLESQEYIHEVREWHGEKVDYDLDEFRRFVRFNNLADSHLAAFVVPFQHRDTVWLKFPDGPAASLPEGIDTVIHRNLRYHGCGAFYEAHLADLVKRSVFIGSAAEHYSFEATFDCEINYLQTPTILALANAIRAAGRFISNQGLPGALAEAMKHPNIYHEYERCYPAALFNRPGVHLI